MSFNNTNPEGPHTAFGSYVSSISFNLQTSPLPHFFLASCLQKKRGSLSCRVTYNLDIAGCIPVASFNIFFYTCKQMVIYKGSARFRFELFGTKYFIGVPAVLSIGSTCCLVFLFVTLRLMSWGIRTSDCQSNTIHDKVVQQP